MLLRVREFAIRRWSVLVLMAIVSAMVLAGAKSQAQNEQAKNESAPGKFVGTTAATAAPPQVLIDNFVFNPTTLTVKVGTTVAWINHDDIPHTVDSTEKKFKSDALDTNGKFEFRFTEAGEYPFFCRLHPKMTGKIVVQP